MMVPSALTSPARYEIVIEGLLDPHWCAWFDGINLEYTANGQTLLTGLLPDQAALRAVIDRIFDLNLPVLSIKRVE